MVSGNTIFKAKLYSSVYFPLCCAFGSAFQFVFLYLLLIHLRVGKKVQHDTRHNACTNRDILYPTYLPAMQDYR